VRFSIRHPSSSIALIMSRTFTISQIARSQRGRVADRQPVHRTRSLRTRRRMATSPMSHPKRRLRSCYRECCYAASSISNNVGRFGDWTRVRVWHEGAFPSALHINSRVSSNVRPAATQHWEIRHMGAISRGGGVRLYSIVHSQPACLNGHGNRGAIPRLSQQLATQGLPEWHFARMSKSCPGRVQPTSTNSARGVGAGGRAVPCFRMLDPLSGLRESTSTDGCPAVPASLAFRVTQARNRRARCRQSSRSRRCPALPCQAIRSAQADSCESQGPGRRKK